MIPLTLASRKLIAGGEYEFTDDGFHRIATADLPGSFRLFNKTSEARTFGLAQEIQVDRAAALEPVHAVTVTAGGSMIFTPAETVTLFVSADVVPGGTILERVPENALTVACTDSRRSITTVYDASAGGFRLA
jgi:hypothetical protein